MICSGGISNRNGKITEITRISTNFKWLQVPFSFSRYRSLAYILMSRYLLFKFALPFSLAQTYKRLVQPYRGFLYDSAGIPKRFYALFFTPVHTQSMPRSRDAAWIDENWTLIERRVRHLERMVLGRYLLSCHTVKTAIHKCDPTTVTDNSGGKDKHSISPVRTPVISRQQLLPFESSLQRHHNEHDGVSNHHHHDCLLNRLFRCRSKKTSKLRVTGLCVGKSPVTG